jgi:hypothetical protein
MKPTSNRSQLAARSLFPDAFFIELPVEICLVLFLSVLDEIVRQPVSFRSSSQIDTYLGFMRYQLNRTCKEATPIWDSSASLELRVSMADSALPRGKTSCQHLSNFDSQALRTERLWQVCYSLFQYPTLGDHICRVSRHENHLELRAQNPQVLP